MKKTMFFLTLILLIMSVSCGKKEKADLVILNGKILTIDETNTMAEAIAVSGEFIVAIGTSGKIKSWIEEGKTEVIDAGGKLVLPGFNDAHVHFGPLDPDFIDSPVTSQQVTPPAIQLTSGRDDGMLRMLRDFDLSTYIFQKLGIDLDAHHLEKN